MEKLVQQLIEKHKLKKSDAINAIRMVSDYLKRQNPVLEKLIDTEIEEKLKNTDGSGKSE